MFSDFFYKLLNNLNIFITDKYQPLMDDFHPFAAALFTLFVIIFGLKIMKGELGEHTKKGIQALVISAIVFEVIFDFSIYKTYIVDTVVNLSLHLTSFFVSLGGHSASSLFSSVDDSFAKIFRRVEQINEAVSWFGDATTKVAILILGALGGFLYILFSVLIMLGVFATYLFLTIGGITFFFFPFESTRFIATAWFRGLMNYALLPVFTGIVMGITLTFLDVATNEFIAVPAGEVSVFSSEFGGLIFIIIISSYFHFKVPDFTSALTGGSPTSVAGIGIGGAAFSAAGLAANRYATSQLSRIPWASIASKLGK